jgi:anaerobic nitric oxide reductase transcription regulator
VDPLVYLNCAALPESVAESELFGHVKGAFTGAISNRSGKFEMADNGTLFLDEIELSLALQANAARAAVRRYSARRDDRAAWVDVRVLAAPTAICVKRCWPGIPRPVPRLSVFRFRCRAARAR